MKPFPFTIKAKGPPRTPWKEKGDLQAVADHRLLSLGGDVLALVRFTSFFLSFFFLSVFKHFFLLSSVENNFFCISLNVHLFQVKPSLLFCLFLFLVVGGFNTLFFKKIK